MSSSTTAPPAWAKVAVPGSLVLATAAAAVYYHSHANTTKRQEQLPTTISKLKPSGNFAPVEDEVLLEGLRVEGVLPKSLDGLYVRAGPNAREFLPHPVQGCYVDGMLHGVRLHGGKASYANHQLCSLESQLQVAPAKGTYAALYSLAAALLEQGSDAVASASTQVRMALGLPTPPKPEAPPAFMPTSINASVTYHARQLLALHEGGLPYTVKVGTNGSFETHGRMALEGWEGPCTVHPKKDARTGELFLFGYNFPEAPHVRVGVLNAEGALVRTWGVQTTHPTKMHDCALTQNYFIIVESSLVFNPADGSSAYDKTRPARFGLLPRSSSPSDDGFAQVQWFEIPGEGVNVFHVANAFECKGQVKVYAALMDDTSPTDIVTRAGRLHELVLNVASGAVTTRCLTQVRADNPVVHPQLVGYPCKWAWAAETNPTASTVMFTGISKVDLECRGGKGKDATVKRIAFPPGCYGGEAIFVPSKACASPKPCCDEGHLLVYVYDSAADTSCLHVYNAASMDARPVAKVHLTRRVPYGFHGTWVTSDQIAAQALLDQ